jgi:hypothetical protein
LIAPRTATRARVPNIFGTSNGAFIHATELPSSPSNFTLNRSFLSAFVIQSSRPDADKLYLVFEKLR